MADKSCFDCKGIDDFCVDCDTESTCSECSGSLIPQFDKGSCIEPAVDCQFKKKSDF